MSQKEKEAPFATLNIEHLKVLGTKRKVHTALKLQMLSATEQKI